MALEPQWRAGFKAWLNPPTSPELNQLLGEYRDSRPVLWLLGKTGAGKSSVVQRLTGDARAQIGNGFAPCTKTAVQYDFPATAPIMHFLDTRGIGEADYDPTEDLAAARRGSHALLILTRVDEPSQEDLLKALTAINPVKQSLAMLHVHTALHTVVEPQRQRAIQHNEQQLSTCLGQSIGSVCIDFTDSEDGFDNPDLGLPELRQRIVDLVPELTKALNTHHSNSAESSIFATLRNEILWYAGAAAAIDVIPAIGLLAVPGIQGKMLHALAGRYGMQWDKRMNSEFIAALGTSFVYRYLTSLGTRQLAKLIPVYGQSAGAAAAASLSFASTYALGRTVCLYLYKRQQHSAVDPQQLRDLFKNAFGEQRS